MSDQQHSSTLGDEKSRDYTRETTAKFFRELTFPVIAVIVAFIIGLVMIVIMGKDPWVAYGALFNGAFGNLGQLGETLVTVTPLICTGLAIAFAYKCGLFNIGAEGQYIMGLLVAAVVGIYGKGLPAYIHIPLTMIAGMAGGALWAAIIGLLKALVGAHEVINSIMLNYVAYYFSNLVVRVLITQQANTAVTPDIADTAKLASFAQINSGFSSSRASVAIFVAVFAAVVAWFILRYTVTGFGIRATGLSRYAAEAGGIKSKKNIIMAMCISGAFAGLGGTLMVMGAAYKGSLLLAFPGFGMDGISVALVGNNNPFGIIFSAILFGVLAKGGPMMQLSGIPKEIVGIMQGVIILFVVANIARIAYDAIKRKRDRDKDMIPPKTRRFFGWDKRKTAAETTGQGGTK